MMMIFIVIIKVIIIVLQIVGLIGVTGSDNHHFHLHNNYNHHRYGHDDNHHHCVTNSGSNWGDGEGTGRSEKVPRGNSTHLASSPQLEDDDQPMILSSAGSKI